MCDFNEEFDLLLNYPLIQIEKSDEITEYRGIIRVKDKDYRVLIVEKLKLNRKKFYLKTPNLACKQNKLESANIRQCLDEIKDLLEGDDENHRDFDQNHINIYRKVLYEYSEFTRFHLNLKSCNLSDDLRKISVRTCDVSNRQHLLEILIDYETNCDIFVPHNYDLPEKACKTFGKPSSSLVAIYDQFLAILEQLQDFFNIMDSLDRNCCILEPEIKQKRYDYRRIWINENLSVLISVDPTNPKYRPDLKFLGQETVVDPYRQRLNRKLEDDWHDCDILTGILTILDLENFPQKPESNPEMLFNTGECCICFLLYLNDKIPEIICANPSCNNYFHNYCLYEWLMSINSKRIFNQIHGQCPNCEKVPNLRQKTSLRFGGCSPCAHFKDAFF